MYWHGEECPFEEGWFPSWISQGTKLCIQSQLIELVFSGVYKLQKKYKITKKKESMGSMGATIKCFVCPLIRNSILFPRHPLSIIDWLILYVGNMQIYRKIKFYYSLYSTEEGKNSSQVLFSPPILLPSTLPFPHPPVVPRNTKGLLLYWALI